MAVAEHPQPAGHGEAAEADPLAALQGFLTPTDYDALTKCVHCGLCLNVCPTYRQNGLEADSPRGRLYLMRAVAEGDLDFSSAVNDHLQLCLQCRACETACPSNVHFGQVMEGARATILDEESTRLRRVLTWAVFGQLFAYPARLVLLGMLLRFYQRSGVQAIVRWIMGQAWVPPRLRLMEQMLPQLSRRFFSAPPGEIIPAQSERRYRVGMIGGCIMPLAFAETNEATVRVLTANGCEVVIPEAQRCCGALQAHAGAQEEARRVARLNVDAFEQWNLDAIIINAAGCGAALKEYDRLLADDPAYAERARRFAEKIEDVSEFLARVGLTAPLGTIERKITYDDPCHLVHGQKVSLQPRALLSMIPGLEYVELRDADRCCGSAGIYNILQPDMSMRVLDDKTEAILESGAETIVTANPGCLIQINAGLRQAGHTASAQHIIDLLDEAIRAGQREHGAAR